MSKDVAALPSVDIHAAIERMPRHKCQHGKDESIHETVRVDVLAALIPPNAILIDPTAPETVAALAGAAHDVAQAVTDVGYTAGKEEWADAFGAAQLPAFVARLRGKP
jgi:hypothetical protein